MHTSTLATAAVCVELFILTLTTTGYFKEGYFMVLPISCIIAAVWILFVIDLISNATQKTVSGPMSILKFFGGVILTVYLLGIHNKLYRECFYPGSSVEKQCRADPEGVWYIHWTTLLFPIINSILSFLLRFLAALKTAPEHEAKFNLFVHKDPARTLTISVFFPVVLLYSIAYLDNYSFVPAVPLWILYGSCIAANCVTIYLAMQQKEKIVSSISSVIVLILWPLFMYSLGIKILMWLPILAIFTGLVIYSIVSDKSVVEILLGTVEEQKAFLESQKQK